ncbi:immunity 52 family protein [Myxococcus vastator]|uniref:immunity 52 family protein n=1 Tax=Myxococcus vastator TaxID=2709664 RepID=UPI001F0736B0|nr:immunity 52 family protein [Myxococcus vastator]
MDETIYAGAYWGPRKELPEDCARRVDVLLRGLAAIDPSFGRWFQLGRSRQEAVRRPIEPTRQALERLIRRGRDRVFEDLGFRMRGWNGVEDDYDATGFDVTCGGYADSMTNFCYFNLPSRSANAERVMTAEALCQLLRCMVLAWEPDSAVVTSAAHRDMVSSNPKPGTFVGWITYVSRRKGTVPPLPAPVRIEPVEDVGTLVVLTPERFMASNPAHVAVAGRVHELLARAGLLAPLRHSA